MPKIKKLIRNWVEYNLKAGETPTYIDFLLVGWGGAWGSMKWSYCCFLWWWGWAWWYIECQNMIISAWSYNVVVGAWWSAWCWYNQHWDNTWNWCDSCFWDFVAYWWWLWWWIHDCYNTTWRWWCCGWSWGGWYRCCNNAWTSGCWCRCQWNNGATQVYWLMAAWWGWAWEPWWCWTYQIRWGNWKCSCITWELKRYAWWGGWAMGSWYSNPWGCWGGWKWWQYNVAIASNCINASYYWWWGGGWVWGANTSCACWSWLGGDWYQWVLIVRYPSSAWYNITWGNSCYECNWYCIHCFTSDWTLTVS